MRQFFKQAQVGKSKRLRSKNKCKLGAKAQIGDLEQSVSGMVSGEWKLRFGQLTDVRVLAEVNSNVINNGTADSNLLILFLISANAKPIRTNNQSIGSN